MAWHGSDTRERLVGVAKELIWERGVEATSPNQLLERSGFGKGSLYHFFGAKQEWALAAIESLAGDLTAETESIFAAVLMCADDLDSLNETLHALRTPGFAEDLAQADAGTTLLATPSPVTRSAGATDSCERRRSALVRPPLARRDPGTRSRTAESGNSDRRVHYRNSAHRPIPAIQTVALRIRWLARRAPRRLRRHIPDPRGRPSPVDRPYRAPRTHLPSTMTARPTQGRFGRSLTVTKIKAG